jgi:hypothetical protein
MNAVDILVEWLNNEFSTKVEVIGYDRGVRDSVTWVFIEIDCSRKLRLDIGDTSVRLVVPDSITRSGVDKSYDFNLYDSGSIEDLKSRIHVILNTVKEDVN